MTKPSHPASMDLYRTVRVEVVDRNGNTGAGTAFFFADYRSREESRSYLVTNQHVLEGAAKARIRFHCGIPPELEDRLVELPYPESAWTSHPSPDVDLCAISVSRLKELAGGDLDRLFLSPISSEEIPGEEALHYPPALGAIMIGYPTGLWDEANNLPLFRLGTTASHPGVDFNGRPETVVDIASFPGSSGSPVILSDARYFGGGITRFLGVLYAGPTYSGIGEIIPCRIPTRIDEVSVTPIMIHLGYVIKAREVLALVRHLEDQERRNHA